MYLILKTLKDPLNELGIRYFIIYQVNQVEVMNA